MNPSDYHIFFDDGGVMNDNLKRGPQWERLVGEYFSDRFGGAPEMWGEANQRYVADVLSKFENWNGLYGSVDHPTYIRRFIDGWVEAMFNNAGYELPFREEYDEIFYSTTRYVTPQVDAAFPGVVETIRFLHGRGFTLHTASGEESVDLNGYLTGMGVRDLFTTLYGPALVSTRKNGEKFYTEIFSELKITPEQAIIIDDSPRILEILTNLGVHVIQACQSGDYQPCFPEYIMSMVELPGLIDKIIDLHSGRRK